MRDSETDEVFAAVLGAVNVTTGKNSYYRIQLLEADSGNQWFLFRA
jgi:poly [ADP-ribose] polymerase